LAFAENFPQGQRASRRRRHEERDAPGVELVKHGKEVSIFPTSRQRDLGIVVRLPSGVRGGAEPNRILLVEW